MVRGKSTSKIVYDIFLLFQFFLVIFDFFSREGVQDFFRYFTPRSFVFSSWFARKDRGVLFIMLSLEKGQIFILIFL